MIENFIGKNVLVTQISSDAKLNQRQKMSLAGLGLRGIGSNSVVNVDKAIMGMIKKIHHKIKIEIK